MSKYDPLQAHLERIPYELVPMRFEEIESILGFQLPPSSRTQRAWWSNNPSNNVMTKAWVEAGFRTQDVEMEMRRLVFRRTKPAKPPSASSQATRHPFIGSMKGTVTIAPGTDLTAPADPDWADIASAGDV